MEVGSARSRMWGGGALLCGVALRCDCTERRARSVGWDGEPVVAVLDGCARALSAGFGGSGGIACLSARRVGSAQAF